MKVGKSKATQILEEYIAETKSSEVNKDNGCFALYVL